MVLPNKFKILGAILLSICLSKCGGRSKTKKFSGEGAPKQQQGLTIQSQTNNKNKNTSGGGSNSGGGGKAV